jgi:hypothetical protein
MSDINLNEIVRNHAMLVSLHIRASSFEIKDREAAAAAAQASGAASSAAYYAKKNLLFGADTRLKKVISVGSALRQTHNDLTMPWDTGRSPYRMLPSLNFNAYVTAVAKAKKLYDEALDDFVEHYLTDCIKARRALNIDNDPAVLRMYPPASTIRDKFGIENIFEPIAEGAKFKNIPKSAAQALSQAFENQVSSRFAKSLLECYDKIHGLVDIAMENLDKEPEDGKAQRWHDSSVLNIIDSARIAMSFNLLEDEQHEETMRFIQSRLQGYDAKDFKKMRGGSAADRQPLVDDLAEISIKVENLMDHAKEKLNAS